MTTLLDVVQTVLSSLDSDEVNSIADTTEAQQVAKIVRDEFYNIIDRPDYPSQKRLFELEASGSASKPVLMYVPDNFQNLEWVKYNKYSTDEPNDSFQDVFYIPTDEFFDMMYSQDFTDTAVQSFEHNDSNGSITIYYRNDQHPTYYTTYNEDMLIFNSHLAALDTTLVQTKSLCYGTLRPTFTMTDAFEIPLPPLFYSLLLNEVKSTAFAELKQTQNTRAERKAKRARINIENQKQNRIAGWTEYQRMRGYGRK